MPAQHSRRLLLVLLAAALLVGAGSARADEEAKEAKQAKPIFDGKTLEGWRVVKENVFEKHGEVKVEDGAIILAAGQPSTAISFQGEFPKLDYEVTLEARRIEGSDFFCGVTFPVGMSHLTLILGGWGGGTTGISNLDDMSAVENETTDYTDFKDGRWYKVRLRVTAEKVQAWIDDGEIVDVNVKDRRLSIWWEQEPVRPFGIATWRTTGAVRKIQLRKL